METAVIVPTLNSRHQLAGCLDALGVNAPELEVVVVNGPSTDGTSGLVRSHTAVDQLVEVAERNLNCARNAGIKATTAAAICLVGQDSEVEENWAERVRDRLADGASVVTGPVHRPVTGGVTTETVEEETICGRSVRYFDGGNVGFRRSVLDELDGFDEYLDTGAARDAAHRLAGLGHEIVWDPDISVIRTEGDDVEDRTARGQADALGLKYRSMSYRAVKNYGLRPAIAFDLAGHMGRDGYQNLRRVFSGDVTPTEWLGDGKRAFENILIGIRDGRDARRRDNTPPRNPNGLSSRDDRAVALYDR
jgi:glycosyltransferase involved in cell wall biosynthesis